MDPDPTPEFASESRSWYLLAMQTPPNRPPVSPPDAPPEQCEYGQLEFQDQMEWARGETPNAAELFERVIFQEAGRHPHWKNHVTKKDADTAEERDDGWEEYAVQDFFRQVERDLSGQDPATWSLVLLRNWHLRTTKMLMRGRYLAFCDTTYRLKRFEDPVNV